MCTWLTSRGACCALLLLSVVRPALLQAQAEGAGLKVAVLRTTQGDAGSAAEAIDGALLRDLAALAGIENPTVSPIDYAEIQLTVGCSDEGRKCLSSIAQMVNVEAIVVRRVVVTKERATLELIYLDTTASDEPAQAEELAEGPQAIDSLVPAVPRLVRRLFGIPEPVVASAPEQQARGEGGQGAGDAASYGSDGGGGQVSALTWVALGVGAVALAVGIGVGLGAQSKFDDYKQSEIGDAVEAERANAAFDDAESQGRVATVLIPAGAAVLALGAVLLVIDLSDDGPGETAVAVGPVPGGGALLALRGKVGGL